MFCPLLKDECNPACVFKTSYSCSISNIALLCQDVDEIKTKLNKQSNLVESMDDKLLNMKLAQDETLTLLRTIKGSIKS